MTSKIVWISIVAMIGSFDEGNEEDLLSQHLDGALDDGPAELSDDSDECSI